MTTSSLKTLAAATLAALSACSTPREGIPRIAELYNDAAKFETRNPVVVIHGILGSRLVERGTDRTVWGAFTGGSIAPDTDEGTRALGLPLDAPRSAHDYMPEQAAVYPAGPLEALKLSLLFSVVSVEVYANILRTLGAGGYTDNVVLDPLSPAYSEDHFTCFSFFYDWRRDNVENAILLGRYLEQTRAHIDKTAKSRIAKLREAADAASLAEARSLEEWLERGYRFDIVAHSMGGLVARYYLRYGAKDLPADGSTPEVTWAGTEQVDRLVVVGTPSFGAMDALRNLVEGYRPSFILPLFHHGILSTMPSIYQLLPRNRHRVLLSAEGESDLDLFDVDVWDRNGWGLLDPESERYLARLEPGLDPAQRRAKARTYVDWCLTRARRLHEALDQRPTRPSPAQIHLFASDTEPTLAFSRLEDDGGRLRPTFSDDDLYVLGDATVPRYSATADERQGLRGNHMWLRSPIDWDHVTFLADDHIGLTSNPHFSNNMLFLLLETRPPTR